MKVNRKQILKDIHFTVESIKYHKSVICYDHREREFTVAVSMSILTELRKIITLQNTLIAHLRGKVHHHNMTLDQQEQWLASRVDLWKHYIIPQSTASVGRAA